MNDELTWFLPLFVDLPGLRRVLRAVVLGMVGFGISFAVAGLLYPSFFAGATCMLFLGLPLATLYLVVASGVTLTLGYGELTLESSRGWSTSKPLEELLLVTTEGNSLLLEFEYNDEPTRIGLGAMPKSERGRLVRILEVACEAYRREPGTAPDRIREAVRELEG